MIYLKIAQGCPIILCDSQYPSQAKIAAYTKSKGYDVHIFAPGFLESQVCNLLLFLRDSSDAETACTFSSFIQKNFYLLTKNDEDFFDLAVEQLIGAILMLTKEFDELADIMTSAAILKSEQMIQRLMKSDFNPWIKMAFGQLFSCSSSSKTAASIVSNTNLMFTHFMASQSVRWFIGNTTLPLDIKSKQLIIFGFNRELNQAITPLIWSVLLLLLNRNIPRNDESLILAVDQPSKTYLSKLANSSNKFFNWHQIQPIILPKNTLPTDKVISIVTGMSQNEETFSLQEFSARAKLVDLRFPIPL